MEVDRREVGRDDGVVEEEELEKSLSKKNLETFESTRCLESKLIL